MAEQLVMRGTLEGHSGWVTSLATSLENPNMLLSGSRDKTLIIWTLTRDDQQYGYPKRSLHGHSHIVSDCVRWYPWSNLEFILILLARLSPPTAHMPSPLPGIKHSACGNSQQVPQLAASLATQMTSSPFLSLPIIAKSSPALVTAQSNYGTRWAIANSPSRIRGIRSGSHACDSARTLRTRSLSVLGGINL